MSLYGIIETRQLHRDNAIRQIVKLRMNFVNEAEFGKLVMPIIDALISNEAATPPHKEGAWSDEEREILRAAYTAFDLDSAANEAAKKLGRTRQQIRSMAANLCFKQLFNK